MYVTREVRPVPERIKLHDLRMRVIMERQKRGGAEDLLTKLGPKVIVHNSKGLGRWNIPWT